VNWLVVLTFRNVGSSVRGERCLYLVYFGYGIRHVGERGVVSYWNIGRAHGT
jgi:hypothetical protein